MKRRQWLSLAGRAAVAGAAAAAVTGCGRAGEARPGDAAAPAAGPAGAQRLPNFVIVYTDDQGYQDLGCFGSPDIKTPNLDGLCAAGMKFTEAYVAQAVCSASRTALLTGCYPNRLGILGALGPGAKHGIADSEMTLGEVVKQRGYATAVFGKWHLGHLPRFLPVRHGFDEYLGLPYSNDMWPYHPTAKFPPLPLIEGDQVVNPNVTAQDQAQLTTWYAERAVRFIEKNKDRPFLLYVPHSMPHVPLYVSDKFKGKSAAGLYGDVIMEIDWSVGRILETLRRHGLEGNTLVMFASDNGPWLSYGDHGGRAGPLREGKGTVWEGGVRTPMIVSWPGVVPAGSVCREPVMTIDVVPTVAGIVGAKLPDHTIDGRDILPLLKAAPGATSPHDALYFYWGQHLQAVRGGKWKLHFPHKYRTMAGKPGGTGGKPGPYADAETPLALYDLEADIGETANVADQHPDVVKRLTALADRARADLGDTATGQKGAGVREPGRAEG
jgi:arylsulfatase A-like enzyme